MVYTNVSNDLVWELTKKQSSFLVKFQGTVFSKDPLNLTKKNSKNSSGLVNDKALSISEKNGNIIIKSKVAKNVNKPSKSVHVQKLSEYKPARKVALTVSNSAKGYRDDLRVVAVKAASQYSRGKGVKKTHPIKTRK